MSPAVAKCPRFTRSPNARDAHARCLCRAPRTARGTGSRQRCGLLFAGMIKQFLRDVDWGEVDYLVVDTPPGTSDEHLSVVQYLAAAHIDGAVIITTPQVSRCPDPGGAAITHRPSWSRHSCARAPGPRGLQCCFIHVSEPLRESPWFSTAPAWAADGDLDRLLWPLPLLWPVPAPSVPGSERLCHDTEGNAAGTKRSQG